MLTSIPNVISSFILSVSPANAASHILEAACGFTSSSSVLLVFTRKNVLVTHNKANLPTGGAHDSQIQLAVWLS
jgi:hypothetical protein